MKLKIFLIITILIIGLAAFVSVKYYSYVFSSTVSGEVVGIEHVAQNMMLSANNTQAFSFAIAVKNIQNNDIIAASSEDRQWAVVQKGNCVEMKYFPYPPWNLEKSGTYYNARLLKIYDCK